MWGFPWLGWCFVNSEASQVEASLLWDCTERGVDPEKVAEAYHAFEQGGTMAPLTAAAVSNQTIQESMRLLLLLRAYQVGHLS